MDGSDLAYEDDSSVEDNVDTFVKEEEIREIDIAIDNLRDELESLEVSTVLGVY